jgi:hypothetical protein
MVLRVIADDLLPGFEHVVNPGIDELRVSTQEPQVRESVEIVHDDPDVLFKAQIQDGVSMIEPDDGSVHDVFLSDPLRALYRYKAALKSMGREKTAIPATLIRASRVGGGKRVCLERTAESIVYPVSWERKGRPDSESQDS